MKGNKTLMAYSAALIACLIWAFNNVVARGISEWMDPFSIAFWRFVIAFIIIAPFVLKNFRKNFALLKQNPRIYIYMGLCAITLKNVLYYSSAHYTSVNNLALLGTTSLIWTAIIGTISGLERLNIYKVIGIVLAGIGAVYIIIKGDISALSKLEFNKGDIIILIAEFVWGIYTILLKLKPKEMDGSFMFASMIFFGLLGLLPIYGYSVYKMGFLPLTENTIYVYLYTGIFASVVSWMCFNYSVFNIGAVRTSLFMYLLPVFSAVFGYLILSEPVYQFHAIGFVLIVSGIFISNYREIFK